MLPAFFGGVSLTDYSTVTGVKAVTTSYFLDVSEDWRFKVGDQWERQLLEDVKNKAVVYCPDLEVSMFVSNTPAWEMERSVNGRLALCYSWLRATGFDFMRNFGEVGCHATSKSSL